MKIEAKIKVDIPLLVTSFVSTKLNRWIYAFKINYSCQNSRKKWEENPKYTNLCTSSQYKMSYEHFNMFIHKKK